MLSQKWLKVHPDVLNGFGMWKNLRLGKIKTLNDYGKLVGVYKQNLYLLSHQNIGPAAAGPTRPLLLILRNLSRNIVERRCE